MTHEQAEKLIEELLDCYVDYERAESNRVERARADYLEAKEVIIRALKEV